ncbi:MAG TPA: hypothetical protein VJV79_22505 [Polyangiaceae bacterium]|nr:hypothetical protein [Polyangiaceae bacterium]
MLGNYSLRVWSALACLSFALATRTVHAEEKVSEEAKAYFQNGVELIQNQPPNYQDAYYQFKLAWDKSHSWKVLGNWGLCALKLERDGEAIWAYSEYLKQGGSDVDQSERKDLERDLLLLNGNAATVSLTSAAPDFEVLDTRAGSSAPPQSYKAEGGKLTLRLRAGTHTLRASYQGKSARWEVPLSPGNSVNHAFDFSEPTAVPAAVVAAPITGATPQKPAESAPAQRGGGLRTAGIISAGVGVAALGTGAVLGILAKGKDSDARSQCVDTASGLLCPERAQAMFDSAKSQGSTATVLLIGGGVFTAAGVGMIIWGGPSTSEQPQHARLRLSPLLGMSQAGLIAQGAF